MDVADALQQSTIRTGRTPLAPLPASSPKRVVGINGRTSAEPETSPPRVCSFRLPLTTPRTAPRGVDPVMISGRRPDRAIGRDHGDGDIYARQPSLTPDFHARRQLRGACGCCAADCLPSRRMHQQHYRSGRGRDGVLGSMSLNVPDSRPATVGAAQLVSHSCDQRERILKELVES